MSSRFSGNKQNCEIEALSALKFAFDCGTKGTEDNLRED
jgi:hypothetical protein